MLGTRRDDVEVIHEQGADGLECLIPVIYSAATKHHDGTSS